MSIGGQGADADFDSARAVRIARSDDARGGYCARGVANICERMGLPVTRGNAHTWDTSLEENGWIRIDGLRPEDAPAGAVLVFDRDQNYRGRGGGAEFGHVEIVAEVAGQRLYVSDAARRNWGGTVPENFQGVYVHPSMLTAEQAQTLSVRAERQNNEDGTSKWTYARSTDPLASDSLQTEAFDGMQISGLFTMLAIIGQLMFGDRLNEALTHFGLDRPENEDLFKVAQPAASVLDTPARS